MTKQDSVRHCRTDIKEVILTLEGALLRIQIPQYSRRMPWEATYRTPGGRFVTRTCAEAMREELIKQVTRTYRELEYGKRI